MKTKVDGRSNTHYNNSITRTEFNKGRRDFKIPDRPFDETELEAIRQLWIAPSRLMDCDENHPHTEKCYQYKTKQNEVLNRLVVDCEGYMKAIRELFSTLGIELVDNRIVKNKPKGVQDGK